MVDVLGLRLSELSITTFRGLFLSLSLQRVVTSPKAATKALGNGKVQSAQGVCKGGCGWTLP